MAAWFCASMRPANFEESYTSLDISQATQRVQRLPRRRTR